MKADSYAYRDRRNRKRDFRRLWITRINAAARQNGMTYGSSCTASSWPGSSSTARCSRTSPCATPRPSADSPRAPARRRRPEGRRHPSRAPLPRSGAFFVSGYDDHLQPQQRQLKEVRKLAGRKWRDKLGEFVAEGEDLMARPTRRAGRRCRARRRGVRARGRRGQAAPARPGLAARLGHARARRLRAALGARRRPGRCAWRSGASTTPATSARCCAARSPSAPPAWRSARAPPTRTATRPCGRRWGRSSRCPWRGCATPSELPGRRIALVAHGGEPLRGRVDGDVTLVVGAEREGLPARVARRVRRHAPHPRAAESLNAAMAATVALYECNRRMAAA